MQLNNYQVQAIGACRAIIAKAQRCKLCGAVSVRGLNENGEHWLCHFRSKRGASTPSLGDDCPDCAGNGRLPISSVGPCNPNQEDMDVWAPPCGRCSGRGH